MPTIHVRQHFNAPIKAVFDTVTSHYLFSEALPFIKVNVNSNHSGGLGSIRHIGVGLLQPLQEKVIVYQPPYRMQYQITGLLSRFIQHHLGTIECLRQGDSTVVDYYVEFIAKPNVVSKPVLLLLKQVISNVLGYHAKQLVRQMASDTAITPNHVQVNTKSTDRKLI